MATLSFKTKFPWGDQTYFIPKIWRGLIDNLGMYDDYMSYVNTILNSGHEKMMEAFFPVKDINTIVSKIHSIREDKHDLWKPGRKIHMAVFNRTKNRFQFAPVLECVSVQRITILHNPLMVLIEDKPLSPMMVRELVRNDGFNSFNDGFLWYFSKDFTGKIINWTEHKY